MVQSILHKWADSVFSPSPFAFFVTALVIFSIPLFLHLVIYRPTSEVGLPSFLLVGPSGSGKTTLLTLFERGSHVDTHTSQAPLSVEVSLPAETKAGSSKYRSTNDPSLQAPKRLLLVDTPGHGKLRYHALDNIIKTQHLRGIIFVVDAANLSTGSGSLRSEGLREAAEYLHDILLLLQKRATGTKSSKGPNGMPLLIATNKLDLFTALPTSLVKSVLESEISKVRGSRARGLLDSGISMGSTEVDEEKEWLGEGGEDKFDFSQMEEVNVQVTVAGGNALGGDGPVVNQWWEWIGSNL